MKSNPTWKEAILKAVEDAVASSKYSAFIASESTGMRVGMYRYVSASYDMEFVDGTRLIIPIPELDMKDLVQVYSVEDINSGQLDIGGILHAASMVNATLFVEEGCVEKLSYFNAQAVSRYKHRQAFSSPAPRRVSVKPQVLSDES